MQWSDGENAGFTNGDPWLKVNKSNLRSTSRPLATTPIRSVATTVPIELRNEHPTSVHSDFELLHPDHPELFACLRTREDDLMLAVLDLDGESPRFELLASTEHGDFESLISSSDRLKEPATTDVLLHPTGPRIPAGLT